MTGTEVVINVTGKMSDGKMASDKKVYRIKGIPDSAGTIRGEMGVVKGLNQIFKLLQLVLN